MHCCVFPSIERFSEIVGMFHSPTSSDVIEAHDPVPLLLQQQFVLESKKYQGPKPRRLSQPSNLSRKEIQSFNPMWEKQYLCTLYENNNTVLCLVCGQMFGAAKRTIKWSRRGKQSGQIESAACLFNPVLPKVQDFKVQIELTKMYFVCCRMDSTSCRRQDLGCR